MNPFANLIDKISNFVLYGINGEMTDKEFLEQSIARWKGSPERQMQIKGFLYYEGEHDILLRKRTMIGEDGKLQVVENLPNNQIIDKKLSMQCPMTAKFRQNWFWNSIRNTLYLQN